MKLETLFLQDGSKAFAFYCPGCGFFHHVRVDKGPAYDGGPIWAWNEDADKPTFSPSLGVNMGTDQQCHLFVRDGKIIYLEDSKHSLRGQTVEMENPDDWR